MVFTKTTAAACSSTQPYVVDMDYRPLGHNHSRGLSRSCVLSVGMGAFTIGN